MSSSSSDDTTAALSGLPSFEDWVDRKIRKRDDYAILRMNVIYYGSLVNISFSRAALVELAVKHNGMTVEESDEFRQAQKEWWYYYRKITILRAFVLQYFDLPPPNWKEEIMPEREYCRVLLSQEDFQKFVTAKGSGMIKLEPDTEESYADDLREKRMEKGATQALASDEDETVPEEKESA